MAGKTINPTRMELTRLKGRLKTAVRGHKLLKDKRDEMMKQFLDIVRRNRALRRKVEEGLKRANGAFTVASAVMGPEMLEQALLYPKAGVELDVSFRNVMSVNVPVYDIHTTGDGAEIYPYGFAQTSGELDAALEAMQGVFRDMLELAEVEKSMQLLSQEIEKTRRRVNALEYVVIPETQRNIRYISMKLDENERGNTTRLMKVKDMVLQEAHNFQM
jgi:V/A-type H+-transporting ATPase subunit D